MLHTYIHIKKKSMHVHKDFNNKDLKRIIEKLIIKKKLKYLMISDALINCMPYYLTLKLVFKTLMSKNNNP